MFMNDRPVTLQPDPYDDEVIVNTKNRYVYTLDGGVCLLCCVKGRDMVSYVPTCFEWVNTQQMLSSFAFVLREVRENKYKIDSKIKQDIDNALKSL